MVIKVSLLNPLYISRPSVVVGIASKNFGLSAQRNEYLVARLMRPVVKHPRMEKPVRDALPSRLAVSKPQHH